MARRRLGASTAPPLTDRQVFILRVLADPRTYFQGRYLGWERDGRKFVDSIRRRSRTMP